ncbi:gliding motility lipoprotein GldH family protein [Porphyromonas endodontalis]
MSQRFYRGILALLSPFFLLPLLGVVGCRPTREAFIEYEKVPKAKWDRGQQLSYRFLITEAHHPYYFDLLIRHNNNVEYCDFEVLATLSNGAFYERRDTLYLLLSEQEGLWRGSGVALTELSFPYLHGVQFPISGIYTLTLEPCSLRPSIRGIENVGVAFCNRAKVCW